MSNLLTLEDIIEAEAIADLAIETGKRLKQRCYNSRKKLEGIALPAPPRGKSQKALDAENAAKIFLNKKRIRAENKKASAGHKG